MTEFINQIPEYISVFVLMLGAFLIGYVSAYLAGKRSESKAVRKLKRQLSANQQSKKQLSDIDTIFTEIKPKIIEVVKETQKTHREPKVEPKTETVPAKQVKSGEEIAANARESYLNYTKNKPTLNFENFGEASPNEREDLTKINGIGPYIEQRLNEIGIYNYEQISRFKPEDIEVLTELIDFFPGRIERDNWTGQAEALTKH